MRHFTRFALAYWIATSLGVASTVSATTSNTGTQQNPQITTTITVTPGAGETITDFHINPTAPGCKIPVGATFTQPANWGAPGGTGSDKEDKSWKANNDTDALPSGASTFTIVLPGTTSDYGWSNMAWTTSSNKSSTEPKPDKPGYVDSGTTDVATGGGIPMKSIALVGPSTISIGELATFRVNDALLTNSSMTYTARFCRSLESGGTGRVNAADPVLDSSGFSFSTNSRTGTTTPSEGVRMATAFGDETDFVMVEVPHESELIGQTIYIQVEFADGDLTEPVALLITG
jgi:hypothetical protein